MLIQQGGWAGLRDVVFGNGLLDNGWIFFFVGVVVASGSRGGGLVGPSRASGDIA